MTKYILGGTLVTLGIIQLADWNATRPEIGYPISAVIVIAWLFESIKIYNNGKR